MSERRFSEQEMALIIRRAAELQDGGSADGGARFSLAEIQEIASEAGVAEPFVSQAAAELQRPPVPTGMLGAPLRFEEQRTLRGGLPAAARAELVDIVRRELGLYGEATEVLGAVEWRGRSSLGATIVSIGERGGDTRIGVTTSRVDQAALVWMGAAGLGVASGLAGLAAALALTHNELVVSATAATAAVAATLLSARLLWRGIANRWRQRTQAVADAVSERAAQLIVGRGG